MKLNITALTTAFALFAGAASAAVVFEDDFSSYGSASVLNAPDSLFGGTWSTSGGTVDYLASGSSYGGLCILGGNCIDLDGSTGHAGLFAGPTFAAGTYTLELDLFGSGRGSTEDVTVSLGSWSLSLLGIGSSDDVSGSWSFSTTGGALSFQNSGGDNVGAILSRVSLSSNLPAVPLPAGLPLLLGGLGALGLAGRRRKKTVA